MGKRRVPVITGNGPDASGSLRHRHPEATIDLHGKTVREAVHLTQSFLHRLQTTKPGGIVQVITGRGMNSPSGPRIRPAVRDVLAGATEVAEFAQALDGGSFLVRLK